MSYVCQHVCEPQVKVHTVLFTKVIYKGDRSYIKIIYPSAYETPVLKSARLVSWHLMASDLCHALSTKNMQVVIWHMKILTATSKIQVLTQINLK